MTEQRESAAVCALAEVLSTTAEQTTLRLHRLEKGLGHWPKDPAQPDQPAAEATLPLPAPPANGALVLVLADAPADDAAPIVWRTVPLDEVSVAYVFSAPSLRKPTPQRLRYFARFLEHRDPLLAEDAYREFGRAPFDAVAEAADALSPERLQAWLLAEDVPQHRKGLYGLALGLAKDSTARQKQVAFLHQQMVAEASDFRAGFDGILGGYLIAGGEEALEEIERHLLANPQAPHGDVRHALTALRFYREYGREIPPERLAQALQNVLARPEFAAAAIVDLARWNAWTATAQIAAFFDQESYREKAIDRAIVGYLRACPTEEARQRLSDLRGQHPARVKAAEQSLADFTGE